MQDVISFMVMQKNQNAIFDVDVDSPKLHCKSFEDTMVHWNQPMQNHVLQEINI